MDIFAQTSSGPSILLGVDVEGCMQVVNVKSEDEISSSSSSIQLVPERPDLKEEDKFCKFLAANISEKWKSSGDLKAWSTLKAEEAVVKERIEYEERIKEIESSLLSLKSRVDHLSALNDDLPESDRLDRTEFELNTEEKQKRIQSGIQREANLHLELRAWQMARKKAALTVRKEIWDDFQVKGKSVCGMNDDLIVRNYPLFPLSDKDREELTKAMEERDVIKENEKYFHQDISALDTPRSPRVNKTRSMSPRPQSQNNNNNNESSFNKHLSGSLSYECVDIESCRLIDQLDVTTRIQTNIQMVLLKNVIRKLKEAFNKEFEEVFVMKGVFLDQIHDWLERLEEFEIEDKGKEKGLKKSSAYEKTKFRWSAKENPELDLPALKKKSGSGSSHSDDDVSVAGGGENFNAAKNCPQEAAVVKKVVADEPIAPPPDFMVRC